MIDYEEMKDPFEFTKAPKTHKNIGVIPLNGIRPRFYAQMGFNIYTPLLDNSWIFLEPSNSIILVVLENYPNFFN